MDNENNTVVNRTIKVDHCSSVKSTHSTFYPGMELVGVFGAEDIDYAQRCFNDKGQNFYIGRSNLSDSGLTYNQNSPLTKKNAIMGSMVRNSDWKM